MSRNAPDDFTSLDEDAWKALERADDAEIARVMHASQAGQELEGINFSADADIDQTGKADDAEDFADISDDDLPDEELPTAATSFEVPGLTDDGGTSHDTDDLFGEGRESSPFDHGGLFGGSSPRGRHLESDSVHPAIRPATSFVEVDHGHDLLFDDMPHATNQDPNIPPATLNEAELLKLKYPKFEPGPILAWNELLPPKIAKRKEKKATKKTKPLLTSKMNLDLAPDSEKEFRVPGVQASQLAPSFSRIQLKEVSSKAESDPDESDNESVAAAGVSFTQEHFQILTDDWAAFILAAEDETEKTLEKARNEKRAREEEQDTWGLDYMADLDEEPPRKRQALAKGLPKITEHAAPNISAFEEITRRNAKRVLLDHNDPHLHLVEDETRPAKRVRTEQSTVRMANGSLRKDPLARFRLSNDEEYDVMKEAHQDRVRATISNIPVEHSLPALKLAWPYYKTRLVESVDQYHRPPFRIRKFVGYKVEMQKRDYHKRKAMKGKAREVYTTTKSLSLMDNSAAVLFEYCERTPPVLSKYGMGNRIISYYRKKTNDDDGSAIKKDIGDSQFLLPEDRSPFARFGKVEPGETVPTLHNQMYRAPLFKHAAKPTDFILGRNSTGAEGARWYLRPIDHLYVVGQTFPYVEVPGPHSRKVTTTLKNRTQMIAFRMIKKDAQHRLHTSDVTKHLTGSNDGQNRQKLKEFLTFKKSDRETNRPGYWTLRVDPEHPDKDQTKYLKGEEEIRQLIKPEDTCLLEAMYLGMKMLEDAGYDPRLADINDDDDGDGEEGGKASKGKKAAEKGEESSAQKMAPWKMTKAFIDASNNKAMLQLHGEGDPTGHGLGFSFIRTSMKGGYLEQFQNGPMSSSADAIEKQRKENNGHAYNVKKQDAAYEAGITEIWEKQKATLSDPSLRDDTDIVQITDDDDRFNVQAVATPGAVLDDSVSQLSGFTSSSRRGGQHRQLRITRQVDDGHGGTIEQVDIVEDPVVIRHYMRRRAEVETEDLEYGPFPEPDPLAGLEFTLPAYTFVPTASSRLPLLAMPLETVLLRRSKCHGTPADCRSRSAR
jgi:transcription initiation factor TFIID subunit 1, fungi type